MGNFGGMEIEWTRAPGELFSGRALAPDPTLTTAPDPTLTPDPVPTLTPAPDSASTVSALVPSGVESAVEREVWSVVWPRVAARWVEPDWSALPLRSSVRALLVLPPGRGLLAAAQAAQAQQPTAAPGTDPARVCPGEHELEFGAPVGRTTAPCGCMIVLAAAWQAVASWSQDQADRQLISVAGPVPHREPTRSGFTGRVDPAAEELAIGLRCSPTSVRTRLDKARRRGQHRALARAVSEGRLPGWHADVVLADLQDYDATVSDQVLDELLAKCEERWVSGRMSWALTRMRQWVKRRAARLQPASIAQQRSCARSGRQVSYRSQGDGSGVIHARLTDDVAARITNRLSAIARGLDDPRDDRSLTQKRADVFVDLLLDPVRGPCTDQREDSQASVVAGRGEEVAIVMTLETLLSLTDDPACLPGGLPVPADVARALAADRRWRAWVTRADGTVVATSPTTYRPGAALARLVRAREPYCRMPGCRSQATDLDHTIPFPRGTTVPDNLGGLCRRHHNLKTHHGWRLTNHADGSYTWTSPAGLSPTDRPDLPFADSDPPTGSTPCTQW